MATWQDTARVAALAVGASLALPLPAAAATRTGDEPLFREVGDRALPGVATVCGSDDKDWILEVNGGGVALGDFDGDGVLDLVVVDGSTVQRARDGEPGNPPRLFLGDGKLGFRPAGEAWAMGGGRFGQGCATGDVNGDGWLDLLVTEWGRDRLFLNEAGEGFREVEESGLAGERWGSSAAFLDYDADGRLDLVVVNYLAFDPETIPPRGEGNRWKGFEVMRGPEGLTPVFDQLYRGRGDGTFEDVTFAAGFRPEKAGYGLGVTTLDYDGDGDTDLYVTNDSTPNHLWENQGDGTFVEVGYKRGVSHGASGREQAGMGIACGDLDGDGREDLFVTNFSGENNSFYVSSGKERFRERSTLLGIAGPSLRRLGWGTVLADFDLSGDLDLVVCNGHVYPQADQPGTDTSYAQPDELFRRDARGKFRVEPLTSAEPYVSRASVAGDLDRDGDLDLVVLEMNGPVHVLENTSARPGGGGWLCVALRAPAGNRDGLGARVTLRWKDGDGTERARSAEVRTAGGFQAATAPEVHFGFPAASELTALTVRWPDGHEQAVATPRPNQRLVVERNEAEDGR